MLPLGMKPKLHGTTPIERIRAPLDALTRQTDLAVSSGMSSLLPYTSTSSLGALSVVRWKGYSFPSQLFYSINLVLN